MFASIRKVENGYVLSTNGNYSFGNERIGKEYVFATQEELGEWIKVNGLPGAEKETKGVFTINDVKLAETKQ